MWPGQPRLRHFRVLAEVLVEIQVVWVLRHIDWQMFTDVYKVVASPSSRPSRWRESS